MSFPAALAGLLTYGEIASALVVFLFLMFIPAPYGKHSRPGWGVMVDSRLSWFFMELPAVAVILFVVLQNPLKTMNFIYLCLWEFHYIYRTFIFPALQRGSRRSFPLVLVFLAFIFNINNGIINGYGIIFNNMTLTGILNPAPLLGLALFLGGFLLNVHSDIVIRDLRRDNDVKYRVPLKGAFRWITNPNYLGEIVEWAGWAILTCSLQGLAFAIFTFCNLFPRAISNHKWYKEHFSSYPSGRKIIFPFLF